MENVKAKLEEKGIKIGKISDLVKNSGVFALIDSNKSKAKKTIVEKLKRFYFLHLYEYLGIGTDKQYVEVAKDEIDALSDQKSDIDFQLAEDQNELANSVDLNEEILKNVVDKIDDRKKIDKKIEKLNDSIVEKEKNIKDEEVSKEETNDEEKSILENIGNTIINETNRQENERSKNDSIDSKENVQTELPEETKKEEANPGLKLDSNLDELQEKTINSLNEYTSSALKQVLNNIQMEISKAVKETRTKTQEECAVYYTDLINQYKKITSDYKKQNDVKMSGLVNERNQAVRDAEESKSHYDQVVAISDKQAEEIKSKDNEIQGLKIDLEKEKLSKVSMVEENELLKKQVALLNRQMDAYKTAIDVFKGNPVVGVSLDEEQSSVSPIEEEPKIR